jgi:hypothetical protein
VAGSVLLVLLGALLTAGPPGSGGVAPAASAPPPATGPAARLTGPVLPAAGIQLLSGPSDAVLRAAGYARREYVATGTASSFRATGPENDAGTWTVAPAETAPYRTRLVVEAPVDPARFNGTVVVEWMNVSGGGDAAVDATYLSPELERAGFAWVGVSAQSVGVDNLVHKDPARYGSLTHPGDQYSFDIYTQVARALRRGGGVDPLAPLHPRRLLAVGESQSAIYLTTYIDAVQPLAHVFDGFLVHSRSGGAIAIPGGAPGGSMLGGAVRIRTDLGVPVLLLITETDEAFGEYLRARQPDTGTVRLWDVAGASHADAYIASAAEVRSLGCTSVDQAPSHFVFEAALHAVDRWMRTGTPPRSAPRMDVTLVNGVPTVHDDGQGLARGGIRGPWVQVPVAAYSGKAPPGAPGFCILFGATRPFGSAQLRAAYGSKAAYLTAYARATDRDIAAGYLLPADRASILEFARQARF